MCSVSIIINQIQLVNSLDIITKQPTEKAVNYNDWRYFTSYTVHYFNYTGVKLFGWYCRPTWLIHSSRLQGEYLFSCNTLCISPGKKGKNIPNLRLCIYGLFNQFLMTVRIKRLIITTGSEACNVIWLA